jgi:hypothetical protein
MQINPSWAKITTLEIVVGLVMTITNVGFFW